MLKHYEYEINKEFSEHFNNDKEAFSKGKNLLSFKMAVELTKRFLEKEKEFLTKHGYSDKEVDDGEYSWTPLLRAEFNKWLQKY
jgi:hypothetical protein